MKPLNPSPAGGLAFLTEIAEHLIGDWIIRDDEYHHDVRRLINLDNPTEQIRFFHLFASAAQITCCGLLGDLRSHI